MGNRKTKNGYVVSNKMDKTVGVAVDTLVQHPVYKKYIKKTRTFKVHDEKEQCNVGDNVLIVETRPLSKDKRWKVLQILEKSNKV
ncbi:MAG: 30S ribosomal protein S17 [Thermodesulfobacteriota bacterium]|nr:30S ribosomal protein S17 [Thermodesulfobacteriota bacterium]